MRAPRLDPPSGTSDDSDRPDAPSRATGPRTPGGKAKSSLNAVTHGLTAKTPLLPGEDAGEFRRFVWDLVEDLGPAGPVQRELATRAAVLMWKRRRVDEAEGQTFKDLAEHYEEEAEDRLQELEEFAETDADRKAAKAERAEERRVGAERNARYMLADELAAEPGQPTGRFQRRLEGRLERLARHEHRINQQIDSTLRLLLKLQGRRQWQERQGLEGQHNSEPACHAQEQHGPGPERHRQGQLRREGAESAGSSQAPSTSTPVTGRQAAPAGAPIRPDLEGTPSPPAPAQNELPTKPEPAPRTGAPDPWTNEPGLN